MPLVVALLLAFSFRIIAFEPFSIPSGSMIPSLLVGDYIAVSKSAYGYSAQSLPIHEPSFHGRILGNLPRRGDVVVFRNQNAGYGDYVKRVVGLPGDHIQIRLGVLYLNGNPAIRRRLGIITATDESGGLIAETMYSETLPGALPHLIAKMGDTGEANNTEEFVVPEDNVFTLGDNRDNSLDSRFGPDRTAGPFLAAGQGVGFLPVENLVGRVQFIYFSIDASTPWWQVWQWPFQIRWNRLLTGIT